MEKWEKETERQPPKQRGMEEEEKEEEEGREEGDEEASLTELYFCHGLHERYEERERWVSSGSVKTRKRA